MGIAVEGPEVPVRAELQATHQVGRALGPQHAPFFVQIGIVLNDPAVTGVIVVGVVEQRRSGEDVAFLERLDRGFLGHCCARS